TRQSALRSKIVGKTKAPKAAKALAKASDFLDAEKYAEAVSSAQSAEADGDFADHALAIRGMAEYALADRAVEKKKWAEVETHATRSIEAWTKILQSHLYSPWWGNSPKEIGKSELELALSHS